MNRYLFKFNKKGYMRFISHLDIQRLFKRCIKLADIPVAYSQGFNPHEQMTIVQPLSLGFESEAEYVEIDTTSPCDIEAMLRGMNIPLPEGMEFLAAREVPVGKKNTASYCDSALYTVKVPREGAEYIIDMAAFMAQESITVLKKDKKSGEMVERKVNQLIKKAEYAREDDSDVFSLVLKCATNEALNPMNLVESIYRFSGVELNKELVRVMREEMYCIKDGNAVSAFEFFD